MHGAGMAAPNYTAATTSVAVLVLSPFQQDYEFLRATFDRAHWDIRPATNCREALEAIRSRQPQIVICEHELPDGSWKTILEDTRGVGEPQVIVTSRLADDNLWTEVLTLGGYDVLMKPFVQAELKCVLCMAARSSAVPRGCD